jgi:hypothetical protein
VKVSRLTYVGPTEKVGRRSVAAYRCACGTVKKIQVSHVNTQHTLSCGCLGREQLRAKQTKHGRYYEPEHLVWRNMLKRCSSPRFVKWYGRVKVCSAWAASYENFLADVGRKPTPQYSLDRIDPSGDYAPGNVRWATRSVQSRNTKLHETSKTGVRGVSWAKSKQRWRAAIYVNNRQKHLGYFFTLADAEAARKSAETTLWS